MPLRRYLFRVCERDGLVLVLSRIENTAISSDNCHDKQTPRQIAEECDSPMDQHLRNRNSPLEDRNSGEL